MSSRSLRLRGDWAQGWWQEDQTAGTHPQHDPRVVRCPEGTQGPGDRGATHPHRQVHTEREESFRLRADLSKPEAFNTDFKDTLTLLTQNPSRKSFCVKWGGCNSFFVCGLLIYLLADILIYFLKLIIVIIIIIIF